MRWLLHVIRIHFLDPHVILRGLLAVVSVLSVVLSQRLLSYPGLRGVFSQWGLIEVKVLCAFRHGILLLLLISLGILLLVILLIKHIRST